MASVVQLQPVVNTAPHALTAVRPKRSILHVIRSLHPDYGGPVEGIRQLISAYSRYGWNVEVACLDDPSSEWLKGFPTPVHALGPSRGKYGFSLNAIGEIRALVRRFDAIIVNGIWEFTGPIVLLALAGSNTPFFVFPHGMLDPWFKRRYPLKHLKKWLYWPWSTYWLLRKAKAVFFTSEEERILARQSFSLYQCNEIVVGYGTTPPIGDARLQREHFEAAFPETRGKRNILYLGRIHPKKGCDLLVEAFAQAMRGDQTWRLVMAGPDPTDWRSELEPLAERLGIADRITWCGSLGGDLKWGAFHAADAFILPSHQENFGIAVAEAMACSVPVLISDKVNIWREIERDGGGLVASDDLSGATLLLDRWAAMTPDAVQAMRAKSFRCFSEHFDVSASAGRMIDVLEASRPRVRNG